MRLKFLSSDLEFTKMIPLIYKFVSETGKQLPLHQCLSEIISTFHSDQTLTILMIEGEEIVGYICGYFLEKGKFLISQGYSHNPSHSKVGYQEFEKEVRRRGGESIILTTMHNPRLFRRLGYKLDRYLLLKNLK